MLDFLRLLTPRHGDALRPASLLHRLSQQTDPGMAANPGDEPQAHAGEHDVPGRPNGATPAQIARDVDARHAPAPSHPRIAPAHASPGWHAPVRTTLESAHAPRDHVGSTAHATRPPVALTSSHGEDRAHLERGTLQPFVHAPLSPATVAMHAPSASSVAPTIHVTIDRIEVRAPASATKPNALRPRTPATTQSLGDYLRGRKGTHA